VNRLLPHSKTYVENNFSQLKNYKRQIFPFATKNIQIGESTTELCISNLHECIFFKFDIQIYLKDGQFICGASIKSYVLHHFHIKYLFLVPKGDQVWNSSFVSDLITISHVHKQPINYICYKYVNYLRIFIHINILLMQHHCSVGVTIEDTTVRNENNH
jgi:hypothetical protein